MYAFVPNASHRKAKNGTKRAVSACRERLDTLAKVEKGWDIFRILIRRRTLYGRVKILKKQEIPRVLSMSPLDF